MECFIFTLCKLSYNTHALFRNKNTLARRWTSRLSNSANELDASQNVTGGIFHTVRTSEEKNHSFP